MYIAMMEIGRNDRRKIFPLFSIEAENVQKAREQLKATLEVHGILTFLDDHETVVHRVDDIRTVFWVREIGSVDDLRWLEIIKTFEEREKKFWEEAWANLGEMAGTQ